MMTMMMSGYEALLGDTLNTQCLTQNIIH